MSMSTDLDTLFTILDTLTEILPVKTLSYELVSFLLSLSEGKF